MKKKYWKIEKTTGNWELDVALERCERVGFFKKVGSTKGKFKTTTSGAKKDIYLT
jgi:hypothetical protein